MGDFKAYLENFGNAAEDVKRNNIELGRVASPDKQIYSFKEKKEQCMISAYRSSFLALRKAALDIMQLRKADKSNEEIVFKIDSLMKEIEQKYKSNSIVAISRLVNEIKLAYSKLILPQRHLEAIRFDFNSVPDDIRGEVRADIEELNRCFLNCCFRSAIIICGRLLEIALHRKYFEETQNDLLEKSPGIGLGNIIAKLKEMGISVPPGLSNQIHLINQVRVSSVHKKQEAFSPTKMQTEGIILLTLDTMERLFGS